MRAIVSRAAALLVSAIGLRADVTLPAVFGDHMVLQQEAKLAVWGWAAPGEKVTVTVGGEHADTAAGADGSWRVELAPLPTAGTPVTMTVGGKNTITVQDVLVGEVWLASGQSNMAFPLSWEPNGKELIAQSGDPQLRVYFVDNRQGIRPKAVGGGHWAVMGPDMARDVSAAAYFFGQQLRQKLNRPVGILQASWGGTAIESWMSREALQKIPEKAAGLAQVAKEEAVFPQDPAAQATQMDDFHQRDHNRVGTIEKAFHLAHDSGRRTPRRPRPRASRSRPSRRGRTRGREAPMAKATSTPNDHTPRLKSGSKRSVWL
jgi:sialate O-acetylesterase